jgi:hypothetical protein
VEDHPLSTSHYLRCSRLFTAHYSAPQKDRLNARGNLEIVTTKWVRVVNLLLTTLTTPFLLFAHKYSPARPSWPPTLALHWPIEACLASAQRQAKHTQAYPRLKRLRATLPLLLAHLRLSELTTISSSSNWGLAMSA